MCRNILEHILKAPTVRQKKWMQECLQIELDVVLTCIGNAYTGSQVIELPLLLRSLCDTLSTAKTRSLPLDIDTSIVELLAAGTPSNALDRDVDSYSHAWWLKNSPPSDDQMLNGENLIKVMKYHKEELKKCLDKEREDLAKASQSTLSTLSVPTDVVPTQIKPILMVLNDADSTPCNSCSRISTLADDLLHQFRGFKTMSNANVGQSNRGVDRIARRAAGFFKLYEASQGLASVKKPDTMPDTPASKWTWGPEPTVKQVRALGVATKTVHSGYVKSLRDGGDLGKQSSTKTSFLDTVPPPSQPLSSREDRKAPPSNQFDFPQYFDVGTEGSQDSAGEMATFEVGKINADAKPADPGSDLEDILDAAIELMDAEDAQEAAAGNRSDPNSDSSSIEDLNLALELYANELQETDKDDSTDLASEAAALFTNSEDESDSDHAMDIDQQESDAPPQFTSEHFAGNLELELFD
ncbi:hypothetical protein JR316_0006162 [Psilocybe cubensis]|uniref:Uncharacterized protein n=2 Tax=Psilocybe cubensis TaxID=181762 RepID=A0A8H8CMV6_PSICU|nr:hypothetical protein JR316_0006162 [Psilocybe cubensis]KAH9481635.1 hypothetical protein JR316_0006162 [Psilocybe cubensis]